MQTQHATRAFGVGVAFVGRHLDAFFGLFVVGEDIEKKNFQALCFCHENICIIDRFDLLLCTYET